LAFRGHDEKDDSHNRGNFLELLEWLAANNEEVSKLVQNAPGKLVQNGKEKNARDEVRWLGFLL
jgi:hypothetical protein